MTPEDQARGRAELRQWVSTLKHPTWLLEAAKHAETTESLARALGSPLAALERCQAMLEVLEQPIYSRQLWGHMARVLRARLHKKAAKA